MLIWVVTLRERWEPYCVSSSAKHQSGGRSDDGVLSGFAQHLRANPLNTPSARPKYKIVKNNSLKAALVYRKKKLPIENITIVLLIAVEYN